MQTITKCCSKCGVEKPHEAFHRLRESKDGRQPSCKECRCAQVREISSRRRPELAAYQSRYRKANRARLNAYFHEYRRRHPEVFRGMRNRWRDANPEKHRAHQHVHRALIAGAITKPAACEECQFQGYLEGHHDDYDKPLEVRWLCDPCHAKADEIRRAS